MAEARSSTSRASAPERLTVDLDAYPDLVVVYLGMRVNRLTGLRTLLGFGPKISKSWRDRAGGIDAVYDDVPNTGMARFAPTRPARGHMFGSRQRAGLSGSAPDAVVSESELYGG